jgi:hypothetical protein
MKIIINNIEYDAITDLNELTIVQFMKLEPLIANDVNEYNKELYNMRISEILCNVDENTFDDAPLSDMIKFEQILNSFNASKITNVWPTHKMIGDTLYVFKQQSDGFTTGEFATLKILMTKDMDPIRRALNMLSIMIRPGTSEVKEGKTFYVQERLDVHPLTIDSRIELFRENLKWVDGQKLISFFLSTMQAYLSNTSYSTVSPTSLKKQPVKKVKSGKGTSKKQV